MGFYINYNQIRSYFLRMDNRLASLGALLDVVDVTWDEILKEESMQGKAAEAIKTYIKEFHKPVIRSIKVLLEEFYDKMLLYMEDYYAHIDAGADTVLCEDGFAAYEELMDMDLNKLSYWDQELERILNSIRGYCDISKPDLGGLETVNRSLTMRMRHLAEDTAAMEASHMEDTEGPEELLESIRKVIADNAWQAQALENVYEIPAVDSADMMRMNSISGRENGMMHTAEMEERLSEALQSERVRRLEERRQGGIEQGIYGAECMLIGGYAIVATGGAAIPIYVTALAAGTGSIAYGFSELAEGVHNYELGSRGDLETASYNILRDEVFFGDQACYDTFGRTAVFISGVIPTVSSLYEWGCSRSVNGQVTGADSMPKGGSYAGPNNIDNLLEGRSELTGSTRDKLLSTVQDSELSKIVNELYRPGATVGDGGTAAILMEEFNNGSSMHLIKATERLKQLRNLVSSGKLSLNDLDIVEALIDDLEYAIGLFE